MKETINLLPRDRLRAIVMHRRITQWGAAVSLCATVVLPAALALREGVDPALIERARRSEEILASLQQQRSMLAKELAGLQQELRAETTLEAQARWESLIEHVLTLLGEDAALERLAIERVQSPDGTARYHLALRGLVREQSDALDLTVRLEGLGVFERVVLEESARRETIAGELISFRIRATLRGSEA